MLGGIGVVIGLLMYFKWRNSESKPWRFFGHVCGLWAVASLLFLILVAITV